MPTITPLALPTGVSVAYLHHHRVCPVASDDGDGIRLLVGPDALLDDAVAELTEAFARPVLIQQADWPVIEDALATYGAVGHTGTTSQSDEAETDLRANANQPPVIRCLNGLLRSAVDAGASDIHLEAARDATVARLRVDGVLVPTLAPDPDIRAAVISRIKLLADMDIAERRAPQDGSFRARLESGVIDVRVSAIPTLHGESVVLRLLTAQQRPTSLDALGLNATLLSTLDDALQRSSGLIVVTGPTGSGKTTTLYAALQRRSIAVEKIITVEDPIEYELKGITQVSVAGRSSIGFAEALRALLRQDPDVIMVGEIRDAESASIAIRAALTGHLVLASLHTEDAPSAVPRLLDLGIPEYLLQSTVRCILAQRLVRRLCLRCRVPRVPREDEARTLAEHGLVSSVVCDAVGCDQCRMTGYRGRIAVFELHRPFLSMHDGSQLPHHDAVGRERAAVASEGTLWSHGLAHVLAGTTTFSEVRRVLQR